MIILFYKVNHSDYCPEIGDEVSIIVSVSEVRAIGMRGLKKGNYSRPYDTEGECSLAGADGISCPVYESFMP